MSDKPSPEVREAIVKLVNAVQNQKGTLTLKGKENLITGVNSGLYSAVDILLTGQECISLAKECR